MATGSFGFEVRYTASGGGIGTAAELRIDADGSAWMFLGSPMSLPPAGELGVVGSFAGRPSSRRLRELARRLSALGAPEPAEPAPPGSVVRFLRVAAAGEAESEWVIPGYPSEQVGAVETRLQQVMADLVGSPAAAVRLEVGADKTLRLVSAGSEPVEIPQPAALRGSLVARDSRGSVLGTSPVQPPADTGPVTLAPGDALTLTAEPPDGVSGRAHWGGGVEFDLLAGDRPRHVLVQVS